MFHIPALIQDLALILGVAAIVTLLFKRLRQPVVLGYILAGLLVGPHTHLFPSVSDLSTIQVWAEMGVIFLLFALGLEFSFRKLVRVGPSASLTAIIQIIFMVAAGYITGRLLGWSEMDSLFLGGLLSISSTTIIIRSFEELGMKGRRFVSLVFGVLVIEDIVAILMLVLLSTVAVSRQFQGAALVGEAFKLVFFLVLWFIGGIFVLPSLFSRARRFLNDETLLILSLALCLLMVILSAKAGFSPALGAFVMGSLLAETREAEKIEHLIGSVKNLFAAIFFVSVGMLIDPKILFELWREVLGLSLLLILGKTLSSTFGALVSGQSLRHSLQTGLSLGQIGEFSFVIAALGTSLKVTSDFLYPLAVGTSVISTLLTPYLIRSADPLVEWLGQKLSPEFREKLDRYSWLSQRVTQSSEFKALFVSRLLRVVVNLVIVVAIFLLGDKFLGPLFARHLPEGAHMTQGVVASVVLFLSSPFLWAIGFGGTRMNSLTQALRESRALGPLVFFEIFRIFLSLILVGVFLVRFASPTVSLGFVVLIVGAVLLLSWRGLADVYHWFEERFFTNLQDKERHNKKIQGEAMPLLAPWDAHIAFVTVAPEWAMPGRSLGELKIRERFGVTVALIERGSLRITAPGRDVPIFPNDRLGVIGTDNQLSEFRAFLDSHSISAWNTRDQDEYILKSVILSDLSPFVGKIIRDSGLREATAGLVVGIERDSKRHLNPDSGFQLAAGDLIWIVGEDKKLRSLKS